MWAGSLSLVSGQECNRRDQSGTKQMQRSAPATSWVRVSFSLELVWAPKPNTSSLTWFRAAQRSNNRVDCDILMTGWRAFRVCLTFSFEIKLACNKIAPAAQPYSKEWWQGNVLPSCIAALKQKRVNLETALTSPIGEAVFRPFPCCCGELFVCFFKTKLSEWQFWTFFFAGHITAIFHSLWDPDPASGRCLHRWVEAWNNTWPASTGPAQGVLTTGGGGTRDHADALCTEPLLLRGKISPPVHDRHVYHRSRHPCSQGYLQGGAAGCTLSKLSWVSLLESKPLNGNHSQHSFASQSWAHRDVQGVLGTIPWLPLTESRQGRHQLEEDTSQNWHREGEEGATWTEGTI